MNAAIFTPNAQTTETERELIVTIEPTEGNAFAVRVMAINSIDAVDKVIEWAGDMEVEDARVEGTRAEVEAIHGSQDALELIK
jgi:hypothetical protein